LWFLSLDLFFDPAQASFGSQGNRKVRKLLIRDARTQLSVKRVGSTLLEGVPIDFVNRLR
jgi:hypothetical protein